MTIKTSHIYPSIPIRSYDWMAWVDGREEDTSLQGYGATEALAVAELQERIEENDEEERISRYADAIDAAYDTWRDSQW